MRLIAITLSVFLFVEYAAGWKHFWRGKWRSKHVEAQDGPPDQWFEQKLDHFNVVNTKTWKQVHNFFVKTFEFNTTN